MNDTNTKNTVMEEKQHSILSPSSSKIWLTCTPSAQMAALMPSEDTFYTHEGTTAHELAEYKVRKYVIGDESVQDPRDNPEFAEEIDEEMERSTDSYAEYIRRVADSFENDGYVAEVFTEIPLDLTSFVPDGKGTADCVIVAGDTIKIIDFKYGAFSAVNGERNSQMMIYALGADVHFTKLGYGPFEKVSMTIFQPRMDNVVSDEISMADLINWRDTVVIPQAALAIKGEGELVKGDHCEFCHAKLLCKKYREESIKNMEKIRNLMNELEDTLTPEEKKDAAKGKILANLLSVDQIAQVLTLSEGLDTWFTNVRSFAKSEALAGKKIPGYKLIEKPGSDALNEEAANVVRELNFDPMKPAEYKSKSALSTEMKKKGMEKEFKTMVLPLMSKLPSSPALVKQEKKGEEKTAEYFKAKEEAEKKAAEEAEKAKTVYVPGSENQNLPPVTATFTN